jgi:hypothetical protein
MSSQLSSGSDPEGGDPFTLAAAVLNKLAHMLRGLTPEELRALLDGNAKFVLTSGTSGGSRARSNITKPQPDLSAVRDTLNAMSTREEGHSYLESLNLNQETLRRLSREFDLPTPRSDTVERLRERIVESSIGYRLRSQAIRRPDEPHS